MDFIKKIILANNADMRMTIDTSHVVSKVYELFIQELSFRAWKCAMSHGHSMILESDITDAVASTNSYNFLNIVLHNHGDPCSTSMVQASTSNITP
jgi:nuclear transcription factor Y, gamma